MQSDRQTGPEIHATQEVRFAVVMYGGLSLAIYMNGVAQEMLRLVRATAPARKGDPHARGDLEGTEAVYRRLGQMLRRGGETLRLPRDAARPGEGEVKPSTPISTRFIVDVISGTSAGGINGVFLAKALANDQSIGALKGLWVEEGDFGRLMNDRWKFPGPAPRTQSILDGRHMYKELLKALEGMEAANNSADSGGNPKVDSPLVEELDLFVTTTDISGLTLQLQLADGVVKERRHRNVFHFAYNTFEASGESVRNQFSRRFNPFLAFAARCTSAFPVAFEPMKLGDIDAVIPSVEPYSRMSDGELQSLKSGSAEWRVFFGDYLRARAGGARGVDEDKAAEEFAGRAFSDGGVLDNKPFSYATDALLRRRADLPVDRKLIFVDPDPQNPDKQPDFSRDVDVLENTLSALSPTVSTETIREDIQRILERNRFIERINYITSDIEGDVRTWEGKRDGPEAGDAVALPGAVWAKRDLSEAIKEKGIAYGGYHRLKVAALTDELANFVAQAANFDVKSDQFVAVRELIRAWRSLTYDEYRNPQRLALNHFVLDFDIDYRLRRLNFLRARVNELSCLYPKELYERLLGREVVEALPPIGIAGLNAFQKEFHAEARDTQGRLSREVYRELLRVQRMYRRRGKDNPLSRGLEGMGITPETLKEILDIPDEEERALRCEALLLKDRKALKVKFNRLAATLRADMRVATKSASDRSAAILDWHGLPVHSKAARATRALLQHYYNRFEDYDMVAFPITYQTEVGETVMVDIIRVSPYDSTALIDETKEDEKEASGKHGRHKLGGTAFGHFGAFLKKEWRTNDILWGRLDAAERIIRTLLPASPRDCDTLIAEAQTEILKEELLEERRRDEVRRMVARSLLTANAGGRRHEALENVRAQLAASPPSDGAVRSFFESCVSPDQLRRYFESDDGYEVDRRLDPEVAVQLLARITKVMGRMLEALAEKHRVESKRVAWVTRLGQVFWGLVEVAVPGSFWNLVFRHWLTLLYLFSALLIIGGALLVFREVQHFGMIMFAVVASAHLLVKLLGDFMRGRRFRLLRPLSVLALVLVAAPLITSAILGLDELLALGNLRDRFDGLQQVKAFRDWGPVKWVSGSPGDGGEWIALKLLGAVAIIIVVTSVLLGGVALPARQLFRRVSSYAEERIREMDRAARSSD